MNKLSELSKTWIFDLDGTLVKHNGFKDEEILLEGVKEFFEKYISHNDFVIILTARKEKDLQSAKNVLEYNNIKVNLYITDLPHGERLIFNDKKISGLLTAYSFNLERDCGLKKFL